MSRRGERGRGVAEGREDHARPPAPGRVPATARIVTAVQRKARAAATTEAIAARAPVAPAAPIAPIAPGDDPFAIHLHDDARAVQRKDAALPLALDPATVASQAGAGVGGPGAPLPHLDRIQAAFGDHDLSGVRAHVGGAAATAAAAIGAQAYATGADVAFASAPDLHLAAHEAAHVVQQRAGVTGVGQAGDAHEAAADRVADRVVRGEPATELLPARGGAGAGGIQRRAVAGGHVVPDHVTVTWDGDPFTIGFDVGAAADGGVTGGAAAGATPLAITIRYTGPHPLLGGISCDVASKTATLTCRLDGRKLAAPVATVADGKLSIRLYQDGADVLTVKNEGGTYTDPQAHRQHFVTASLGDAMLDSAIVRVADPQAGASPFDDDPLAAGGFGPGDARIQVRPQAARVTIEDLQARELFDKMRAGRWNQVGLDLAVMPMAKLLDTLQRARDAGLLDAIAGNVASGRVELAQLSVMLHLGIRWRVLRGEAQPEDRDAVDAHVTAHALAGDPGVHKPMVSGRDGTVFHPASGDPSGWLAQWFDHYPPQYGHFSGKLTFNFQAMEKAQIVDLTREQAALDGVMLAEEPIYQAIEARLGPPPPEQAGPAPRPDQQALGTQLVAQYMVVFMGHVAPGGQVSADNPNHQIALQYTVAFHKDGKPGFEGSIVAQVTAFADRNTRTIKFASPDVRTQTVTGGIQVAYVAPFIGKFSQIQAVLQAAQGVAFDARPGTDGAVTFSPDRTQQIAGQTQLVFDLVGNDRLKLQLVALGQVSHTSTDQPGGAQTTIDFGGGVGLQLGGTF